MKTTERDDAATRSHVERDRRAQRNRSAWPVPMHVEQGELKEDRPLDRD